MSKAWLYDGSSGVRQPLDVATEGGALRLTFQDGRVDHIAASDLEASDIRRDASIYGHNGIPGWRLTLAQPIDDDVAAILPRPGRYGGWVDRIGLWPAVGAGLVVSALVLGIGYFAPGWVAPLVPPAWEKSYGDALVGDFGGKFCTGAPGQSALDSLALKLDPGARDLNIRVVDIPMVNAAALPGGNVVIFRQLLSEASGPDEVAGVLAHEIAHVRERHVTEAMIRHLGVGMIVTTLGGSTGGNVDSVLALSYGREAEREADASAIRALAAAGISPNPTARFFARLAKMEGATGRFGEAFAYLSTHPLSKQRQAAFTASADRTRRYGPALTPGEWAALRGICADKVARPAKRG